MAKSTQFLLVIRGTERTSCILLNSFCNHAASSLLLYRINHWYKGWLSTSTRAGTYPREDIGCNQTAKRIKKDITGARSSAGEHSAVSNFAQEVIQVVPDIFSRKADSLNEERSRFLPNDGSIGSILATTGTLGILYRTQSNT